MFSNFRIGLVDKVPIINNWLGRQGLQPLESFTQVEQEACNAKESLFEMLNNKFKPQYNETIKSKMCKLLRQTNENTEEWMGRIRVAATECNYKE